MPVLRLGLVLSVMLVLRMVLVARVRIDRRWIKRLEVGVDGRLMQ